MSHPILCKKLFSEISKVTIYTNGMQISVDKLLECDLHLLLAPVKLHIPRLNTSMNRGGLGGIMSSYVQTSKGRKNLRC